ncbi:MAG: hypothetical protein HUK21_08280 [Fibrobacteraceae bacterium]|nr:hypothetical protein [Fibrobacteraceae bacterium]
MTSPNETPEIACFDVNQHGRLICGNRRFCRMFGFEESEVMWHYITDLYRFEKDWLAYKSCDNTNEHHFVCRMRNRKGRSFKCSIVRTAYQNAEGTWIFHNVVSRLGENENPVAKVETPVSEGLVFLAKCADCGCQVPVRTLAETRLRMLCNGCAAKAYPDAYHLKEASL